MLSELNELAVDLALLLVHHHDHPVHHVDHRLCFPVLSEEVDVLGVGRCELSGNQGFPKLKEEKQISYISVVELVLKPAGVALSFKL